MAKKQISIHQAPDRDSGLDAQHPQLLRGGSDLRQLRVDFFFTRPQPVRGAQWRLEVLPHCTPLPNSYKAIEWPPLKIQA